MNTLGNQTPEVIIHKSESHKLHQEFDAGSALSKGQLVKLDTDGKVVAFGAGNDESLCVGYTIQSAVAEDDKITVATRGYTILKGQAAAASQTPGPVEAGTFDGTTKLNVFAAATSTGKTVGWALTGGNEGDEILVLIKD